MKRDKNFKLAILVAWCLFLFLIGVVIGVKWEHHAAADDRIIIYEQGAVAMARTLAQVPECKPYIPHVTLETLKMEEEE